MGMYTELHLNAELRKDTPAGVVRLLDAMCDGATEPAPGLEIPGHALFRTIRWPYMLCCASYYFAAQTHSEVYRDPLGLLYLCIRCNLKNYDNEIELFLDWIDQYIDAQKGEFLGFKRYEEENEPTLIYKKA